MIKRYFFSDYIVQSDTHNVRTLIPMNARTQIMPLPSRGEAMRERRGDEQEGVHPGLGWISSLEG